MADGGACFADFGDLLWKRAQKQSMQQINIMRTILSECYFIGCLNG